jgi:hypothetical protein
MLAEDVGFVEAAQRLGGNRLGPIRSSMQHMVRPAAAPIGERDPEELAAIQAAVTLYHHSLLGEPRAMAYLSGRGLDRAVIEQVSRWVRDRRSACCIPPLATPFYRSRFARWAAHSQRDRVPGGSNRRARSPS